MKGIYHKFLRKIAHFQVEHPFMTLVILLTLTLAIYGGVSQVRTVASLEQMMPQDIEEIKAFNTLRDNNLGQDIIAVVINLNPESTDPDGVLDIRDERVYDYVNSLQTLINQEPDIISSYSFADVINNAKSLYGDNDYDTILKSELVKTLSSEYINSDLTTTTILFTTDIAADDSRMNLLTTKIKQHIESIGHPSSVDIKLTGTPVIQQRLGSLISMDRKNTQLIAMFFVFIITMIIFGTFTSALVPIIVVTIGVNWLYGTMGYVGLPISTLAGGVAAMVIGIGIDFSIHIMNKFKYERKNGLSIKQAIEQAVVDTGTALTATSLTTISAFLAFLIGAMPEMGRFGLLMAIGITYALIFSLFGLPALLIIEERIIAFLKPLLRFGVEGELMLTEKHAKCPAGYSMIKVKHLRKGQRVLIKKDSLTKVKYDPKKYRGTKK
ncbi:MAG: MMPL family transporter [Nanoarchaeota archaeon]|nr:MMPL family transporter [Nanoarchaeota archaeon]